MENKPAIRRLLPYLYWLGGLLILYFILNLLISPYSAGISLTARMVGKRIGEIGSFLIGIFAGIGLIEVYFYQIFFRQPKDAKSKTIIRSLQTLLGLFMTLSIFAFFEITDLFRSGSEPAKPAPHRVADCDPFLQASGWTKTWQA